MINALKQVANVSGIGAVGKMLFESSPLGNALETTPGQQTGQTFSAVLGDMMTTAMDNIKEGEVKSFEGLQGKASTREVVDAVMQAEQSLQTAMTIRDKLVSAFLDITKMQI